MIYKAHAHIDGDHVTAHTDLPGLDETSPGIPCEIVMHDYGCPAKEGQPCACDVEKEKFTDYGKAIANTLVAAKDFLRYQAALASLQGFRCNYGGNVERATIIEESVKDGDALLAELERTKKG
jgi:hypothetical protein